MTAVPVPADKFKPGTLAGFAAAIARGDGCSDGKGGREARERDG